MSAHYQIFHDTHYHYDSPVSLAQQLAHLWPRACAWQHCSQQELLISPDPTSRRDELDVFGNPLTRLAFERPHDELLVNAQLTVEVLARPALDFTRSLPWDTTRSALTYSSRPLSAALMEACRYRFESPYVHLKKSFVEFSESCFPAGRPLLLGVQALMEKIFSEFTFDAEATQVATPLVEVLERRRGVCQDFAHLMLACLRSRGLAARYVSGYLLTQPPPGQPRLIGADASHAWVSVFCPVLGWVDFDPTNNVQPALEHITLAWGRDFSDVSPLRGVILGGGSHDPEVRVTVMPLNERISL
ncbi:transglutaminase family protein [Pseudomonas chlororaphis]|uniref:transglutaminase family protein n=1 Tax=Pseudomonas chlororaphis TaxID=587753 RepID=UPI000E0ACFBD|nr:transglutaminase family protein [Pseudomonas chlororaphis]AZD13534.1 Small protein containing transglutaminase-like domain [Pseudomonas chlororaphis]WDH35994.1 transglutaminase family protein [Pseudomonas chlororaphis]WDH42079.1 transglutaminase family protein [Pseudomonas chlororaphis]WDH48052.1 transglutaminase family protein [Pseudomonas chlororaphis]WDH59899.1 transglutaminase family protein [Pseudomonas chlororaphis]